MFERFIERFPMSATPQLGVQAWRDVRLTGANGYLEFAERFAGCSFSSGLYRFHDVTSGPKSASLIADAFPDFSSRACPFGYDWLGRQFALDSARSAGQEPLVLLLEPGTGEALEVPASFAVLHEQLDELREPALAASFFNEWAAANAVSLPIPPDKCVGYGVPLFLGGRDVIENLELIDMEVYWTLCGQLRQGSRRLPPGTSISGVSISF